MSHSHLLFYDAANPRNIPSGVHAAVYINGEFKWPQSEIDRMAGVFSVSVEREAYWAQQARCIDVEKGAALPEDVVSFIKERRKHYDDATAYVNRSNWDAVRNLVAEAHIPQPFYWVSTLDGTTDVPGAWAVQDHGGMTSPYDTSILFGVNNFHKP